MGAQSTRKKASHKHVVDRGVLLFLTQDTNPPCNTARQTLTLLGRSNGDTRRIPAGESASPGSSIGAMQSRSARPYFHEVIAMPRFVGLVLAACALVVLPSSAGADTPPALKA